MNELMEKMDNLIDALDSSSFVTSILEVRAKISLDKELSLLLEKYEKNPSDELKKEIMNHPLFQEYKEKETDLNLFILDLNQKLKKISKKGSCQR